jgi:ribonucleoside-diphosphate reductase beta chain
MLIKDSKSPLFTHSLVYRPFRYEFAETLRKQHEQVHWVPEEAEISDDIADWRLNSSADERANIKANLTLFTTGDVAVASNYVDMFLPVFKNNEIRNALLSIAAREAIHQEAYALVNDTFGLPDSLFSKFKEYSEMRDRVDLMCTRYDIETVEGVALALAHTVFNEGVALFGAFVNLLNYNRFDVPGYQGKKGRFKGFAKINKWSLREESLHVEFGAGLHKQVVNEHISILNDGFKKQVYDIARAAVAAEDKYIDLAFSNFQLYTITKEEVKQYIRFMADRRLIQLGYKPIFGVKDNPCPWIDEILGGSGGKKMGNFFEVRIDDYSAAGALTGELDWDKVKLMSDPQTNFGLSTQA